MSRMMMTAAVGLSLMAGPAFATGSHAGGHDEMAVGKPGKAAKASRTVKISMKETDDGRMLYEPSQIVAKKGETIRIVVTNTGETDHEFILDEMAKNAEHKKLMEKFPEMEHEDPNALRLAPGKSGEIVWTFSNPGEFEFACLIPGHYESGMHGPVKVSG
ncbi:cupredoxin family protein [Aureimonas sp. SA4125]|uniref:cupredoxin domain-containing protein n=1 Tax=Aureimonas sp. SA4125 TaxID=2826993 RepID=UPI001CC49EE5|nr:cupredoxin family protein [Aureimonas sp. SA4125]